MSREWQADADSARELIAGAYITHCPSMRALFEQPHMSFVQCTVLSLAKHWVSMKRPFTNKVPFILHDVFWKELHVQDGEFGYIKQTL